MKNAGLLIAAALLLPFTAWGQDSAMSSSKTGTRTVTGCLSRIHKDQYVITAEGPGPKQFRVISGDVSAMQGLQEHTIRATGVVGQSDPREQVVTPPNPGSTTGATYNTIEVQQVQDVSSNCSVPGKEEPK